MRTIIIGLGNPILGDDGAGWQVAHLLRQREGISSQVTIECLSVGGISLMEALIGYDRAIIIDVELTGAVPVGTVKRYKLEDIPDPWAGHISSPHDTTLQNALQVGRSLHAILPEDIIIVTIEAQKVYEFSEDLTPKVAQAIPQAVGIILDLLIESNRKITANPIILRDEEYHR